MTAPSATNGTLVADPRKLFEHFHLHELYFTAVSDQKMFVYAWEITLLTVYTLHFSIIVNVAAHKVFHDDILQYILKSLKVPSNIFDSLE